MEIREPNPFFESAALNGAGLALAASLVLYGSMLILPGFSGIIFGCLGCCGLLFAPGLVTVRQHIAAYGENIELGRGSVIGFTAGLVFGIVFNFMEVVWGFFGINTAALFLDTITAFIEEHGDPEALDNIEEMRRQQEESGFSVFGLLFSVVIMGTVNLISGMAGTAIFKKKEGAL
ncbi:MAG: hypothetical protein LAT75_05305 [Candidatus Cyclonatronum sp.]|uniref:hypothetical protein n=1 Tax=Cyclonatronum sp. TaxID=3024185 RepID=UPI0025C1B289|nr:hypothetical protein [Cyclonatronum sp.]MCC5934144.1 hypothetical protein [Balneolales bacterium]MCH8486261.1 hypothetical protein [Cyclonatronum sp.]